MKNKRDLADKLSSVYCMVDFMNHATQGIMNMAANNESPPEETMILGFLEVSSHIREELSAVMDFMDQHETIS